MRASSAISHQEASLAKHLGPPASIDGAIAHNGGVRNTRAVDHGAAAATALIDDAATARADLVDLGVARTEQDGLGIHHEGDAGLEIERSGQEGVARAFGLEDHCLALGARIERVLDAIGIEPGFIGIGHRSIAIGGGERGA